MQEPIPETEPADPTDADLAASPSTVVLELQAPPRVRPWLLAMITGVAALTVAGSAPAMMEAGAWDKLVLLIFAVLVVPIGLVLFVAKPPGRPLLQLGADRMRLPITTRAQEFVTLRYREITELFWRPGRAGFVWIGTEHGTFVYPLKAFQSPEEAVALLQLIHSRLEPLPDWDRRREGFEQQQATADRIYGGGIIGTKVVLAIMLVAFAVQSILLPFDDPMAVVGLGANVPVLVKQGQLYRLVTSNLLHANVLHLVMNAMLVVWLGSLIERLLGRRTFILVALLSALLGPAASALSAKVSISVGISSVPFGMLGAFAFLTFKMKGNLPPGFTPPMRMWLTLGLLLAVMSLMVFGTDFPAHLGGFLAGVLVAAPLLEDEPQLPLRPGPTWLTRTLIGALSALMLAGAAWGAVAAVNDDGSDQTRAMADYLERQLAPASTLNLLAWLAAVDPKASPERLELARVAAHRSVSEVDSDKKQERLAYEDTLATVYYRQGKFDEAIDREAKVLAAHDGSTYATQMARFLRARLAASGVRQDDPSLGPPTFEVRYHDSRGFGLEFSPGQGFEPARTVWLLVELKGELQGLLRLELTSKIDVSRAMWLRQVGIEPVWHEGSTFRVAWVQATPAADKGWLMDGEVLTYP